jgi:hypothetical protein
MRRQLIIVLALSLAACGGHDDEEKLKKAIDSWSATLQLVADARLRNDVPRGFAIKTIEAAIEDLSAQAAKPAIPRALSVRAERIIGISASLRENMERDDRTAIANARRNLAAAGLR